MKSELPVKFELQPIEEIPVVEIPKKAKKKMTAEMIEAQTFAKFGVHSLRIKSTTLAALGKEADEAGIKHICHGRIIVAAGNAESAVTKLNQIIDDLLTRDPVDHGLVMDVMRMLKDLNAQVIHTARVQMAAEKQQEPETGGKITLPFPSGSPIMIGVGKPNS